MTIRLWVPGTVPPGMIERAVEAAWPGAHTVTAPATPPLPAGPLVAGGTLRLARPEILPLKTGHDSDRCGPWPPPAAGLADGEHAIVQVLARPVTGARLRQRPPRRPAAARRAVPPGLASRLLDAGSAPGHRASRTPGRGRSDPELAAEVRGRRPSSAGPQWDTLIRYAVATTAAARAGRRRARTGRPPRRPGRGCAAWPTPWPRRPPCTGRNWLARRRLRHPAAAIAARRFAAGRPAVGARARRDRPAARRPVAARPGPRRGPRRPPAARHPAAPARASGRSGVSDTGRPRPVGLAVADARHHLRVMRRHRHRQDHPDRRPDPRRRRTRAAGWCSSTPRATPVTDLLARLPEQRRGEGGAVRPRRPGRAAVPERAARRRVRHRHTT